jgi:DNA-binding MarR family transcriptional regulator
VTVYLTELGRELIAKVFPRHAKVVTKELGFLTDKEKDALEKLLRKFK